jgi:hypothetical protein
MSKSDNALGRLLRSAARAPREQTDEAPYGFEQIIAARLRRAPWMDGSPVASLFRQGLAWAGALMIVALAVNYIRSQNTPSYEVDDAGAAWAIIAHE